MNMRKIKLKSNYRSARHVSAFAAASLFAGSFAIAAVEQAPPKNLAAHPEVAGALAVLDAWIDGVQGYEGIPGISAGLVLDQQVLLSRGYGFANLEQRVPAAPDTIYSICSISKLFTSIGVMQQRDAGKLRLRDTVAQHLDWFEIREQHGDAGPARIQGLLTHSSGLPREADFSYWVDPSFPFPSRRQMIERLPSQSTLYPADSLFQYSNLGLTLAGEIVAGTSGLPYADYVRTRILEPLQMRDTRPSYPLELRGTQLAIGYSGKQRGGNRSPLPPFETRAIVPAAGFTSTVADLASFASWQFRTASGKENEILAPNTLREMQRVHWVDEDWKTTWGLGFVVSNAEGTTVVGHGGGCPGYITSFLLVPKHKVGAIVLTNAADGPAGNIAQQMLKTIGTALKEAAQPFHKKDGLPDLSAYAGSYANSVWGGETAVRVWGNKLAVLALPSDNLDELAYLQHVSGDEFARVTKDGDTREPVVFRRDSKGRVVAMLRHSQVVPRVK